MSVLEGFRDPKLCRDLLARLEDEIQGRLNFMEVCGTHTVSIFQSGLHSLLPASVKHISGPGCPVCVTHESEVAAFLEMASMDKVIVATFGDLMKVPGPKGSSLKNAQAEGARIEVVYSPADTLRLAKENPGDKVAFLGVGFETTAPTIAATVKMAEDAGLDNLLVLSFHKLVPPALEALVNDAEIEVDALILPGHVSTVIGMEPYAFLAEKYNVPSVVAGFEPADILRALLVIVRQQNAGKAEIANAYTRAVSHAGNAKAREIMYDVFDVSDALWRGIGRIPNSGLVVSEKYAAHDALRVLGLELRESPPLPGCRCGDVLKGKMQPNECPLFKKKCTPANPVGPCMVSTEGSCAAYFKYHLET